MARYPYLIRRNHQLYFHMAVPKALQKSLRKSEIIRTLSTQNLKEALPKALQLAAETQSLFNRVELLMADEFDHDQFVDDLIRVGNDMGKPKPNKPNSLADALAKKQALIRQEERINQLERQLSEMNKAIPELLARAKNEGAAETISQLSGITINVGDSGHAEPLGKTKIPRLSKSC
jgi:3-methyladenine DNA glycosylase AlkC